MSSHSAPVSGQHSAHTPQAKPYLIGFVLAAILTVIPFAMVMMSSMSKDVIAIAIAVMAAVQMLVHVIFFLHLDGSPQKRLTVQSGLFTLILIAIMMVGSLWVMYNMDVNMMPSMNAPMSMPMSQ